MNYQDCILTLRAALSQPLPGQAAQYIMAPSGRPKPNLAELNNKAVRKAGVLALIYNAANEAHLVLTERSTYRGVHSGQISFPGGKKENEDPDFKSTALRETHEEIGVPPTSVEVLGPLTSLYIPPSNFLVHPFIGTINSVPSMVPDPVEVSQILSFPLDYLIDDSFIKQQKIKLSNGLQITSPTFVFDDFTVWGATAMILAELKALLK